MAYNFKEKKTHFIALRNPDAAVYDFELLRKKRPLLPQLKTYARDPKRYADDILYSLLDYTTRDEIRAFRRQMQEDKISGNKSTAGTVTGTANSAPAEGLSETHSAEDTADAVIDTANSAPAENLSETHSTRDTPLDNESEDVEELKQSLEEAEQRAEEAEEAQEEAEARAEEAEQALEAEKKKELPTAPVKSKSTRSTRKSTGTTSSTRKSK